MSRPNPASRTPPLRATRHTGHAPLTTLGAARTTSGHGRRPSVSGLGLSTTKNPVTGGAKAQRTSKTTQKLVELPTEPQTKPLPSVLQEDEEWDAERMHGYETDGGVQVREYKSVGERMSKDDREKAGYKRITAYCVAEEGFKMKLLASFLKREHNVRPRVFDEAMYAMYYLPLLPGYGPNSNIRSSAPPPTAPPPDDSHESLAQTSEAEADAEESAYESAATVTGPSPSAGTLDGFFASPSFNPDALSDSPAFPLAPRKPKPSSAQKRKEVPHEGEFAEAVFFAYGVVVFFGFEEPQERSIIEDLSSAGIMRREMEEARWEIEQCHYAFDPNIAYPRIYNDFFTFKSQSPLLTLSVSHALAQSTLLARYETLTDSTLSSPRTRAIPIQLASSGSLSLSRTEALKITGRLFRLRRDVNLAGNVLDVPEVFWVEGRASLRRLYDAVRSYMEIDQRVEALNEKLGVGEDLLGAIHDHLNNNAMERITWIIIWLIVVACLVEIGEVVARLIVHSTGRAAASAAACNCADAVQRIESLSREEALAALERMAGL